MKRTTKTMQVLSLMAPQHPKKAITNTKNPTTMRSVAGEK